MPYGLLATAAYLYWSAPKAAAPLSSTLLVVPMFSAGGAGFLATGAF